MSSALTLSVCTWHIDYRSGQMSATYRTGAVFDWRCYGECQAPSEHLGGGGVWRSNTDAVSRLQRSARFVDVYARARTQTRAPDTPHAARHSQRAFCRRLVPGDKRADGRTNGQSRRQRALGRQTTHTSSPPAPVSGPRLHHGFQSLRDCTQTVSPRNVPDVVQRSAGERIVS